MANVKIKDKPKCSVKGVLTSGDCSRILLDRVHCGLKRGKCHLQKPKDEVVFSKGSSTW